MPTKFEYREYVEAGGLASFRFNWENQTRRTAAQLDKLLRRETPGKIPFELPTRQEFVLNMRTARALGLDIPRSLVLRADAVIE
jgi:putative ABC transport system substrate-binding protein